MTERIGAVEKELQRIRKTVRKMALIMLAYSLCFVAGAIWAIYQTDKLEATSKSNQRALCNSLDSALRQRAQTREFIKDNPEGTPGLPRPVLDQSLENIQLDIDNLRGIKCDR